MHHIQEIHVPRRVAFGPKAVQRIPSVCKDIGIKTIKIFSGRTQTKKIASNVIIPQAEGILDFSHTVFPENVDLEYLHSQALAIRDRQTYLMAVGGGKVIDYVKVIARLSHTKYVAVPTNASHDGFSSPYVNFLLREQISKEEKNANSPIYTPVSPIAIVGDTSLISQAPKESLQAGVGDILAKWVAVRDWKLAHRLKGENFDIYAATFSEMTANMVEEGVKSLGRIFFSEEGIRVLMKALGSSGVAMCIAGSSRPASGSEHLVSHALDKLSHEYEFQIAHGHQTGMISILMMYLHGANWKRIRNILVEVAAPVTLHEMGIEREILLEAMLEAHKIRPERYTILAEGLSKQAAINAIEMTGID
ncbi:MAG: iron-containing alcohol dehydrogenase [Candidatus Heimdallarchaeota archaeon]|nr:MAG: iron-containing alcohol dehydrogenase [Candidatus Heimdallarchaeota archaeon]